MHTCFSVRLVDHRLFSQTHQPRYRSSLVFPFQMRLTVIVLFALIVHVELRYQNVSDDHDEQRSASFNRQKKYSSRKKVLDEDVETDDEQFVDKPQRPIYSAKNKSRSSESETNRRVPLTTTPATNYLDEASLCINEFDVKSEQLVKVKEFKNGAHMIRIVRIEEPSSSHGLDIKDICMLNCCVEKSCDLAMLSEQATNVSSLIVEFSMQSSSL